MPVSSLSRSNFNPMDVRDAFDAFSAKVPLPSSVFDRLSNEDRSVAFRIAQVENARTVMRMRSAIQKALNDGDFRGALNTLREELGDGSFARGMLNRLSIIYRQSVGQAWAVNNMRVLDLPEVKRVFQYRMYMTVGDGTPGKYGVRASHAELHGRVFSVDEPDLKRFTPPIDWGCRCYMVPLRERDVIRLGKKPDVIAAVHKKTGAGPGPEFDVDRDRFDLVAPLLKRLDADLLKKLRAIEEEIVRDN